MVIVWPSSAARAASSVFHNRVRDPLDPPPSAVIGNRDAPGWVLAPMVFHQRRIVSTANAAVAWSVPTPTQPVSLARS
jgi:hypothetical protein